MISIESTTKSINELLKGIITSETYELLTRKKNNDQKKIEELNDIAFSLGFRPDNYYSPKDRMEMENELNLDVFESNSPMGRVSTSH